MVAAFSLLVSLLAPGSAALAASNEDAGVPKPLEEWRDWVLRDEKFRNCPFLVGAMPDARATSQAASQAILNSIPARNYVNAQGWQIAEEAANGAARLVDASGYVCAWPGRLTINAMGDHADFAVQLRVDAPSWVGLPGDVQHWPQQVSVNGELQPVLERNGAPALWLSQGTHDIKGTVLWPARPQSLRIPGFIGLVWLNVDGKVVAPVQRDRGEITLGRVETSAAQSDSLDVRVFRRLSDGLPSLLTTEISLVASGQSREEVLGPVLPQGLIPTAIETPWPARIDRDGRLRVQVRPGRAKLTLQARATSPLNELELTLPAPPWPRQEIWSYAADPALRGTLAHGGLAVDPVQTEVPDGWRSLPAFALNDGDSLRIEENGRGEAADEANRLTLRREAWLDFSEHSWSARDVIAGTMKRDWRFDVVSPFTLQRAESAGEPLLITQGSPPHSSGVEWRQPRVDLRATVRISGTSELPVTGWQQNFDRAETLLHFPYGYRLFAVSGADSVSGSWTSAWRLRDVFIVALLVMMAWKLFGVSGAMGVAAYVVLGYQETGSPLWTLMAAVALGLLIRQLPIGRLQKWSEWLRLGAIAVLVLTALPFAAHQLRAALYPQLENSAASASFPEGVPGLEMGVPASDMDSNGNTHFQSWRSRADYGPAPQKYKNDRYGKSNVLQTGAGEPEWQLGSEARLSWSGPVVSMQTLRLFIAPPALVRSLRLLLVGALGVVVWLLWRDRRSARHPIRRGDKAQQAALALLALVVGVTLTTPASAEDFPPVQMLEQLHDHLTQAPKCMPDCATITAARVRASGATVTIALDVSAGARVALPIPAVGVGGEMLSAKVDATADMPVVRVPGQGNAAIYGLTLERGVHRVEITYSTSGDRFTLNFPLRPMYVVSESKDWTAEGVEDARLLADTLTLLRQGESKAGRQPADSMTTQQFPPFVRVVRTLSLGLDYRVTTTISRISPVIGGFTVSVPLIAGEHVSSAGIRVQSENGQAMAMIAFGDGSREVKFDSTLDRDETLTLAARPLTDYAEQWRLQIGPLWHVEFSGVPLSGQDSAGEGAERVAIFDPLPAEKLTLRISRPEPVQGPTRAIDHVKFVYDLGQRSAMQTLKLELRSSQGGEQTITLPDGAEVISVTRDGTPLGLRPQGGRLELPLQPGRSSFEIRFRSDAKPSVVATTPEVALGLPAANIELTTQLPGNRWLLLTSGPTVGPAVLYWGELVVMAVVALLLARSRRTQLKFHHWLLLGIGFSTTSWVPLLVVVAWLFAMSWRARDQMPENRSLYNLVQVGLVILTAAAVVCLLVGIGTGMMAEPDMQVVGNESSSRVLQWFTDRSQDALPQATIITVPMWIYKVLMLLWALWLAIAALRWLRDAAAAWTQGGYWADWGALGDNEKRLRAMLHEEVQRSAQGAGPPPVPPL